MSRIPICPFVFKKRLLTNLPNVQLTDGGPLPTSEFPERLAGPPFGEASGSARATTVLK
jgi:hypothetical protein